MKCFMLLIIFICKIDNTLIFRSEDNTALNEAMTDIGSSLVIPQKEGYVFNKTFEQT